MRLKLVPAAVSAVLAISLLGATGASAATEFGSDCTANRADGEAPYTVIQLTQNGVPVSAPVSGIVTQWKVRLVPVPFSVPQQLKVFRPTANPIQFQVVGESATHGLLGGENAFPTRIPIKAGDQLGLFGPPPITTLYCAETPEVQAPGNSIGVFAGNPTTGAVGTLAETRSEHLVPVRVVIEPDADNDGFGDETQDACPQSATTQAPCPVVTVSTSTQVRKGAVTIVVTPSTQATVTVKGLAKLGKGKKAKLNGGTQILAPGLLGKFRLGFPKALKKKLKALPRKRSMRLNVTVSATSVSGAVTTKTLKLKLKGQAKSKKQSKPKGQSKG